MSESKLSQSLYSEYHVLNRNLTYMTIALVCLAALLIWIFNVDLKGERTTLMGLMFMLLAAFTFKIPHISYRFLKYKYKNNPEKYSILGADWKSFRDAAMLNR